MPAGTYLWRAQQSTRRDFSRAWVVIIAVLYTRRVQCKRVMKREKERKNNKPFFRVQLVSFLSAAAATIAQLPVFLRPQLLYPLCSSLASSGKHVWEQTTDESGQLASLNGDLISYKLLRGGGGLAHTHTQKIVEKCFK